MIAVVFAFYLLIGRQGMSVEERRIGRERKSRRMKEKKNCSIILLFYVKKSLNFNKNNRRIQIFECSNKSWD